MCQIACRRRGSPHFHRTALLSASRPSSTAQRHCGAEGNHRESARFRHGLRRFTNDTYRRRGWWPALASKAGIDDEIIIAIDRAVVVKVAVDVAEDAAVVIVV